MRLPNALNPLRGTPFAWLFPFTWEIVQGAASAAPTTIEVFLHHRFGSRSGKALLKGFLLLLLLYAVFQRSGPPATFPLFKSFLVAYFVCAVGHWLTSQCRTAQQTHSYSSGQPWPLLQEIPLEITTIQRYIEPAFCILIASVVALFDSALAHWLVLAAIALFIKGQISRAQLRTRRLDAFDNRAESERLAPRARPENEQFVEARPAPPLRPREP